MIRHRSISSLLDGHEESNKTYYQFVRILLVYIIELLELFLLRTLKDVI